MGVLAAPTVPTLLLVRHAEIDNSQGTRFIGRTDLPLTPRGERQAARLRARLSLLSPRRTLLSPQLRARQTGGEGEILPDLREIDFGTWETRLAQEVEREHPEAYARWRRVDPGFAFPEGEALAAVASRVLTLLNGLWDAAGPVAVVSHGGVLRLGLCQLLGLPWAAAPSFRFDFAGITRLERHGGRVVLAGFNDTTHLEDAP